MTKFEFIRMLRNKLSDFPRGEVEEQLRFYTEMIEDRMEEGIPEEEAVAAVGSVDEIASQIASEIPIPQKEQETAKPKRKRRGWEIVLLIFGSPMKWTYDRNSKRIRGTQKKRWCKARYSLILRIRR